MGAPVGAPGRRVGVNLRGSKATGSLLGGVWSKARAEACRGQIAGRGGPIQVGRELARGPRRRAKLRGSADQVRAPA